MGNKESKIVLPEEMPNPVIAWHEAILNRPRETLIVRMPIEALKMRRTMVQELLSTEHTYVMQMTQLYELYLQPIYNEKSLSNALKGKTLDLLKEVQPYIMNILETNRVFYQELKRRLAGIETAPGPFEEYDLSDPRLDKIEGWHDIKTGIGEVFLKMAEYFRDYIYYISRYNDLVKYLVMTKLPNSVQKAFDKATEQTGHPISNLLILPIQRIPRYELLFREAVKQTPQCHDDYEACRAALAKVQEVNKNIDADKDAIEQNERMTNLSSKIKDCPPHFIQYGSQLVGEGPVMFLEPKQRKPQRRYVVVLSHGIYVLVHKGSEFTNSINDDGKDRYVYKGHFFLQGMSRQLVPAPDGSGAQAVRLFVQGHEGGVMWQTDMQKQMVEALQRVIP